MLYNKINLLAWLTSFLFLSSVAQAAELNVLNAADNTHIRSLAASCAACHGSNGNSLGISPVLAGLDATYFSTQMRAFKSGERPATVMHHHAKGLNTEEIELLALYFSKQKRLANISPKPQTLKANHD